MKPRTPGIWLIVATVGLLALQPVRGYSQSTLRPVKPKTPEMTPQEVSRFKDTKALAEKGDAEGQLNLGICYTTGNGVAKDYVQAVKWYRKASEQGDLLAQTILGHCYAEGEGVAKDQIEAYAYWNQEGTAKHSPLKRLATLERQMTPDQIVAGKKRTKELKRELDARMTPQMRWIKDNKALAEEGDAEGQLNLGICYTTGNGVAKDYAQAVAWYRKAADQGHTRAQFTLGGCYAIGQGVSKDEIEAYAYWSLAGVEQPEARKELAVLEKQMTPDQIIAGKNRTKELKRELDARVDKSQNREISYSNVTGVLTARYNSDTEAVFKAAKGIINVMPGTLRTGETDERGAHKELSSVIFYARTTGDQEIKISIEKAEDKVTKAIFTQVKVKYGAFGNMPESEKIVSRITSNLR